ncbi:hypothetical protein CEXT_554071 [Caerostris extrusa]|uniref:Secreted protein n=1 Tax=Caerostris extrusa TaxID=172846 RepID=A0AAV4PBI3_CAEEX|nr:hypothetical protein CEXT_554071 [Caerostris extrusa]
MLQRLAMTKRALYWSDVIVVWLIAVIGHWHPAPSYVTAESGQGPKHPGRHVNTEILASAWRAPLNGRRGKKGQNRDKGGKMK